MNHAAIVDLVVGGVMALLGGVLIVGRRRLSQTAEDRAAAIGRAGIESRADALRRPAQFVVIGVIVLIVGVAVIVAGCLRSWGG